MSTWEIRNYAIICLCVVGALYLMPPIVALVIYATAGVSVIVIGLIMAYTVWWDGFAHRWTQKGDR